MTLTSYAEVGAVGAVGAVGLADGYAVGNGAASASITAAPKIQLARRACMIAAVVVGLPTIATHAAIPIATASWNAVVGRR